MKIQTCKKCKLPSAWPIDVEGEWMCQSCSGEEEAKASAITEAKGGLLERMVRGSTPELSDASTGWWWLWCDEQWCAAYVRNEKSKWTQKERLDVTWLRPSGGMSRARLELTEVKCEKWGGRIAAPNAGAERPAN